jgi:hypothetical protein
MSEVFSQLNAISWIAAEFGLVWNVLELLHRHPIPDILHDTRRKRAPGSYFVFITKAYHSLSSLPQTNNMHLDIRFDEL